MTWPAWVYRLDDPRDVTFGVDKEAHLLGAAYVDAVLGDQWAVALILVLEAIQVTRWLQLSRTRRILIEEGRARWPFMADKVSLKDIVAGLVGIGLHHFIRLVIL